MCSRYGSSERHRIVEDRLMRQKAQLLLDEAASWSLLWYIYGKGGLNLSAISGAYYAFIFNLVSQVLFLLFLFYASHSFVYGFVQSKQ